MKSVFAVFILLLSACSTSGAVVPETSLKVADQELQDVLKAGAPAAAMLIVKKGEPVFLSAKGKRSLQQSLEVQPEDVWHLGSDTKAMTAFLIALAVQEERLGYQTEIMDVLKVSGVHNSHKNVTVAQLLTQSSGIQDFGIPLQSNKDFAKKVLSHPDIVMQRRMIAEATLKLPPIKDWKPGKFAYTNINYIIVGHLLEEIYRRPWETLMKERVFAPLGMDSCGFGVAGAPDEEVPSQPWPHVLHEGQLFGLAPRHKADNAPFLGPAGTVHCSLQDWGKFITELIGTFNGSGRLIQKSDVVDRYFSTNGSVMDIYTHGGWGRVTTPKGHVVFQHSGSNTMNYAKAIFSPEKGLFILMATNAGHEPVEKAFGKASSTLVREFVEN